MLRRPWEVSRMTSGATPISLPILVGCQLVGPMAGDAVQVRCTHVSQCLTTASVESMMVPSMSKRKPSKVISCGGRE